MNKEPNQFERRMERGDCCHCGERESGLRSEASHPSKGEGEARSPESNEEGVLCDECRDEMWRGAHRGDGL